MAFTDYTFSPGLASNIFLPVDGSKNIFTSTLRLNLSAGITNSLEKCYGKYGVLWKWSTFESTVTGVGLLSSLQPVYPSTWKSLQYTLSAGTNFPDSPGPYPKKWTSEGALSAELFNPSLFNICSASNVVWTDRKSTRLNSSHVSESRMPSSA